MKLVLAALGLLLLQGSYDRTREVEPSPQRFQFQRTLQTPAGASGQACAIADAAIFAHTAGRLNALRMYSAGHEVPFALTESGAAGQQEEPAQVLNLGRQGAAIVFDLAMPQRPYTEVVLDIDGRDFYATARVFGQQTLSGPRTALGQYTMFDLSSQGLSRSTTLSLQEATFPLLHVEMNMTAAPGGNAKLLIPSMVRGASVPPSREAQMLFTTVAETSAIATRGHESLATLHVPAHVPVERVHFVLPPAFTKNFSREVSVTARPSQAPDTTEAVENLSGEIQRVHLPGELPGQEIRSEALSVEAILASDLRSDATVQVAVENGDDNALPLSAVQLQMRQRKICFDAEPGAAYVLRYGDAAPVRAPIYDYARLFRAEPSALPVALGPETPNPDFRLTPTQTSYTDRHPELLWVALLLAIAALGTVALHNARRIDRTR